VCTIQTGVHTVQFFYDVPADSLSLVQGLCQGRQGVWSET
jgi:hypothetical protein